MSGTLSPNELAERCRVWGARVELDGNKYKVYPADRSLRPLTFSAAHIPDARGSHYDNLLRDLRKAGVDVRQDPPSTAPQPAAPRTTITNPITTTEEPTVSAPERKTVPSMATRTEVQDVRDMVRTAQETVLGMLADADKLIGELRDEVGDLRRDVRLLTARVERAERGGRPPEVSAAEKMRAAVLAYFEAHRGEYLTAQVVDMNLVRSGVIPADRMKTAVATACKQLSTAGRISGGGSNGNTSDPMRGVYYLDAVDTSNEGNTR